MITSVTYARLYNLGSYENERLEVTVSVEENDATAAFITAVATVEAEHARMLSERQGGARYQPLPPPATPPAPASDKQRQYIARLADDLGWTSEQIATYASEQGVDLAALNSPQASKLINNLKRMIDQQQSNDLPF